MQPLIRCPVSWKENKMAEINFELFNNTLVQQLVGAQDGNLRLIEKILGVEIGSFGNQMNIKGSAEAIEQAKTAIDVLYNKVSKGISINEEEVKAAVRIAGGQTDTATAQDLSNIVLKTKKRHIYPRSATQAQYIQEMMKNELVFGLGPAGTGKTYLAVALAVSMMLEGRIDKIILSRPAVEAGENLGFLPGDLKEKVDPYLRPLYDALYEMLPAEQVDKKIALGEIEIAPLAFMRGRTLSNAFVILDEAQNTTPMQMKMFLTRLGENSRMVVNGDLSQVDLPRGTISGLRDALEILQGTPNISSVRFNAADVVRHGLVAKIVKAYEERSKKEYGDE
ncbi:MAG: PhoH family protein [Alphaproteobacteria bacterium]|nr:PhoH family protein [Alphaproteobacteria bacterium]